MSTDDARTKVTMDPPKEQPGRGMALAAAGALLVLLLGSLFANATVQPLSCKGPVPAEHAGDLIFSRHAVLALNQPFCVAINTKRYFAETLTDLDERGAAVKAAAVEAKNARQAVDELAKPLPSAPKADLEAYETKRAGLLAKVADTEKKLQDARARRDALSKEQKLALFIDDKRTPVEFPVRIDDTDGWFWAQPSLQLPRDADPKVAEQWRAMLGGLTHDGEHNVKLGVGDAKADLPREGADRNFTFVVFSPWVVYGGAFLLVAAMGGLIRWQHDSDLLRDRFPAKDLAPLDLPSTRPYSLGRVQFAFWFLLSLGGFLFIWLTTGQVTGTMTTGVVTLLGISAASGVVSVTIGPGEPAETRGFLLDILGGEKIELHRVQMVVWTVIIGAVFVWSVAATYAFPVLEPALLLLAGSVSAAYTGFKIPENKG